MQLWSGIRLVNMREQTISIVHEHRLHHITSICYQSLTQCTACIYLLHHCLSRPGDHDFLCLSWTHPPFPFVETIHVVAIKIKVTKTCRSGFMLYWVLYQFQLRENNKYISQHLCHLSISGLKTSVRRRMRNSDHLRFVPINIVLGPHAFSGFFFFLVRVVLY